MGQVDLGQIEAVLSEFRDPETGRSIMRLEQVRDIKVENGTVSLVLELTTHSAPLWAETQAELVDLLRGRLPGLDDVKVQLAVHDRPPEKLGQIGLTAKSVISVTAGKGGVGKSTIAASVAFGLKRAGCVVGLMDADVYGPSIPHLLGVTEQPDIVDGKFRPIFVDGVPVISMGLLVPQDQAVMWRGPMLHSAVTQFLRDTAWGNLDYLVIDMPPGTGDVALSLSQLLPLTGAVIVCTPQPVALLDATKAISMQRTMETPVLGMVENMSHFICPDCGKRYDIFGSGGAREKAEEMGVPFLGEVPINMQIRVNGDEGKTVANFDDPSAAGFLEAICRNLAKTISERRKDSPALPSLPVL